MTRARHVTAGDMRNAYRIVSRKPEVQIQLKRPRHKWENNIKMYPKVAVFEWVQLAQKIMQWQALTDMVMNLRTS
jgi:hypothetical protein